MVLFPFQARWRRALSFVAVGAVGAPLVLATLLPCRSASAQEPGRRVPPYATLYTRADDRAVLGVVLAPGSRADTAGVRLEEVDAAGPAAKAGLKAGDILTEINGTSLRITKEDAEDLAPAGLAQRRLQRALAKVSPGDDVTLRVRSGSAAARTVTVKTVSAASLEREEARRLSDGARVRVFTRGDNERVSARDGESAARGVVGLSVTGAGNVRDTLGLFINAVTTGGPAEKAGVVEGERIAAVNGIDVRVPKEDVDDAAALSARLDRFLREMRRVEAGKSVALRVYGNGRYRDVTVTAARASELPATGFSMSRGDGAMRMMIPRAPNPPRLFEFERDGDIGRLLLDGREIRIDAEPLRRSLEEMRRGLEEGLRGMEVRTRARRTTVIL